MAKRAKKRRGLIASLVSLILLIGLILLGGRLYFRLPVRDYYAASEPAFAIPGLTEGFVPQGLAYDAAHDVYLVGGYMKDGRPSPIYAVNRSDGAVTKSELTADANKPFTGHAGGLAVSGDTVLVAGSGCLWLYSLEDVIRGGTISPKGQVLATRLSENDPVGVAFVHADGNIITVGEFYREPNYPTADTHKFTAPSGEKLQALAIRYLYNNGVLTPFQAYALPDLVQGMTFHDDRIWLSTSWGAAFSGIGSYPMDRLQQLDTLNVDGTQVPLYALDAGAREALYKLPPMSEEIIFRDGKLLTMCESASRKYWFGLLTGGQWCYATDLTKMAPQ